MTEAPSPGKSRRLVRNIAIAAVALLMLGGIRYGHWALVEHRMVTVEEGELYQSAEIPPAELVELVADRGIQAVIDLRDTEPQKMEAEAAALEGTGVRYLHLPTEQDPTPEQV